MMELWNLFDVIYVDKSLELEIKTLCSRLSIPKIVKHRSHVHNLRAARTRAARIRAQTRQFTLHCSHQPSL